MTLKISERKQTLTFRGEASDPRIHVLKFESYVSTYVQNLNGLEYKKESLGLLNETTYNLTELMQDKEQIGRNNQNDILFSIFVSLFD